jgi:hypothetical protein
MLVNQTQSYFRDLSGTIHIADAGAHDFTGQWEGSPDWRFLAAVADASKNRPHP